MRKIVSIDEMRALERDVEALGLPGPALMENAGRAVADAIRARISPERGRNVAVLVGPGNNGGDGLVVARHLFENGWRVTTYLVERRNTSDAKVMLLQERSVPIHNVADDPEYHTLDAVLEASNLVVDALLGAAHLRPITSPIADVVDRVNQSSRRFTVVAVDVPSGIDADSGAADRHAIRADFTITLACPKRGLYLGEAARLSGALVVEDIGIPASMAADFRTSLADRESIAALLPDRPRVSHKGSFGKVLIVAGSRRYTGAPVLAAVGAERVGAGLVMLACPASVRDSLAMHTLETTFLPLPDGGRGELTAESVSPAAETLADFDGVLVGPGIGRSAATAEFLAAFLSRVKSANVACVVDADGLTLLGARERWWELLPDATVLTPHPGEMSRLTGQPEPTDRIEWARRSAVDWNKTVVLKGASTVVARGDGEVCVLPFANPALATAGTGDVLAGAILGFVSQKLSVPRSALVGAYVHGQAGELLLDEVGVAGGLAGDLASHLPRAMRVLRESRQCSLFGDTAGW